MSTNKCGSNDWVRKSSGTNLIVDLDENHNNC